MKYNVLLILFTISTQSHSKSINCEKEVTHYLKKQNIDFSKLATANISSQSKKDIKRSYQKHLEIYKKDLSNSGNEKKYHTYLKYNEDNIDRITTYNKSSINPELPEIEMKVKDGSYIGLKFQVEESKISIEFDNSCKITKYEIYSFKNDKERLQSRLTGNFCNSLKKFKGSRIKELNRYQTIQESFDKRLIGMDDNDKHKESSLFLNEVLLNYYHHNESFFNDANKSNHQKINKVFEVCLDTKIKFKSILDPKNPLTILGNKVLSN
jgi:hypothetical protein